MGGERRRGGEMVGPRPGQVTKRYSPSPSLASFPNLSGTGDTPPSSAGSSRPTVRAPGALLWCNLVTSRGERPVIGSAVCERRHK